MRRKTLLATTAASCILGAWLAYPALAHRGKCIAVAMKIAKSMEGFKITLAKAMETAEVNTAFGHSCAC